MGLFDVAFGSADGLGELLHGFQGHLGLSVQRRQVVFLKTTADRIIPLRLGVFPGAVQAAEAFLEVVGSVVKAGHRRLLHHYYRIQAAVLAVAQPRGSR